MWPNVIFSDKRFDYAFTVWGNSTLGLLLYWWHSSRQQSSKASVIRRSAPPLKDEQLRTAEKIFNDFRDLDLAAPSPTSNSASAKEIFNEFRDKEAKARLPRRRLDPNRALLGRSPRNHPATILLGFDEDTYTTSQPPSAASPCRQVVRRWKPSVHGGKPRPKDAKLVI